MLSLPGKIMFLLEIGNVLGEIKYSSFASICRVFGFLENQATNADTTSVSRLSIHQQR